MNIIKLAKEADIYVAHLNKPMTDKEVRLAFLERFAALVRADALAEPDIEEMTLTQIASRHEPVTQEPVACEQCEELGADKARWYRMADMFAQQAQELKGVLRQALNLIEGEWPEGDEVAQPVVDNIKKIVGERSDG